MKSIYTALAIAATGTLTLLSGTAAHAQGTEDLSLFSRHNFGISSARSAGMGGAFTSLGADPATLSINPAGIAMYRNGEVTFSPGLRVGGRTTTYSGTGGNIANKDNLTKGNISSASIVYAGKNYAIGFGMNRLADFNSRSRVSGYGEYYSILDMFAAQLYGIPDANIGDLDNNGNKTYQAFFDYPPSLWGAILGYQAFAVDPVEGSPYYSTANMIGDGTSLSPGINRKSTGAINEYAFSGGYNYNDILYVGASIGIQDIYHKRVDQYSELASLNNFGLDELLYRQFLHQNGTGINLKVGVTVRPVSWLRIGLAYHSPTWVSMTEDYDADLTIWDFRYTDAEYRQTAILSTDYDFRTPSRLMFGISAQLGNKGIISVDYEHTWYNKMKYTSNGYEDVNATVGNIFRGGNTVRVGLELQPLPAFFLRAGYGYSASFYKAGELKDYGKYQQASAGLGYRAGIFNIDVAYIYGTQKQLPYKPYDYTFEGENIATDGTIHTKERNHNVILTLAFKF